MTPAGPTRFESKITRRRFGRDLGWAAAGTILPRFRISEDVNASPVALVQGHGRASAIEAVIESLGGIDCQGKDVYIKASFNSPHPFPATTHPETLERVIHILRKRKCGVITVVERSGMGSAGEIWRKLGFLGLADRLKVRLLSLDDLPGDRWRQDELPGSHWKRGVEVPDILASAPLWIQICNLKTHRFGGRLSASLKNSVGLIAKYSHSTPRYNYMAELHASPDQRQMIAEINQLYSPALVIMDATEVFVEGGPESGEVAAPGAVAASRDRVALDAVGLAILRLNSPGPAFGRATVFEQEQIKRAGELGLGAKNADEILVKTVDHGSANLAMQIKGVLSRVPDPDKH